MPTEQGAPATLSAVVENHLGVATDWDVSPAPTGLVGSF